MFNQTIGIYMPTHNRVELLKKAVNSVLSQTYTDFKLLIVDDGSTDDTFSYLQSLTDPRISFIRNEVAQGACAARNKAIETLKTELITGLDDDDEFLPCRLADLLSVYTEDYAFVCSGYFWDYGLHKKPLFTDNREISLSDALDLNQCSNQILTKRSRLLAVGGFDENIPALQDQDLWVRLIAKFGKAYRIGKPSYIVNDDHSLERISSIKNKLRAIEMFEKKHHAIMLPRNKANFLFYKQKIKGENISFLELLRSSKYGLVGLKTRQYLSQYFKSASQARLNYLRTGELLQWSAWFSHKLLPLLATGGPGASRVILLSACIFFLGLNDSSSFSSDFFIIMLLNTSFSQCFGFFLLKPEYKQSFYGVTKQSLYGLFSALAVTVIFALIGLISELYYSLILVFILHFYYIYRFKNIAEQYFFPLAFAEVVISALCLFLPYLASVMQISGHDIPYQIYIVAMLLGLLVVIIYSHHLKIVSQYKPIPFNNIKNISISTTASIFAIFLLPSVIKVIANAETVSIVALTISCISISMLIPRTYANKIMAELARKDLTNKDYQQLSVFYKKLIIISVAVGLSSTIGYLYLINPELSVMIITISLAITIVLVSAQLGFISLTYLSLQGADQQVAKLNLGVLIVTALVTIPAMLGVINMDSLIYIIVLVASASFIVRNKIAANKTIEYLQ